MIALLSATALGGSTLGLGLSGGFDLPGPDAGDFGLAPGLWVPLRVGLSPAAGIRFTLSASGGAGVDEVSWAAAVAGTPSRIAVPSDFALVLDAVVTVGPDIAVPTDGPVGAYFGAEFGGGIAAVYHNLGESTAFLIDPAQNDLDNPKNIDPYTLSPVLASDLHIGARSTGDGVGWWGEIGYSGAWLGSAPLQKSLPEADARREGIAWNPLRLGVGVSFAL